VQPATTAFDAAEIHGLVPQARRPGIKNPMAIMAALEGWVPGAVAPSTKTQGIIRYALRDVGASITGIDPHREPKVSALATQMRQGTLQSLYTSTSAIILGDRLAQKIGARVGANITVQASNGASVGAQVVGTFRSGITALDEGTAYVLLKTAQVLARQSGLVNELRVRVADVMAAHEIARRIERETGYKSVSWQEANQDLLSAFVIRNIVMYTVVGAILLVASFGTYNIISTITHEKTRDIAILKSLGLREASVRRIFVIEALAIGLMGSAGGWVLGYALSRALGSIEIKNPMIDMTHLPLDYSLLHYAIATGVALGASLVAGYFPARKASRLYPVDIIRGAT
jgi:lipoprotein-releasing system permease protein